MLIKISAFNCQYMKMFEQILNSDFTYISVNLNEDVCISILHKNYILAYFINLRNIQYV